MRFFEAQALKAKRLGVRLSAVLPRVRPDGPMISAVAPTPGEALCYASGENFVVAWDETANGAALSHGAAQLATSSRFRGGDGS